MNTQVKNFTIVEGSRSRMVVHMDESLDLDAFEVYAGNEKCKCRMLKYHEVSKADHTITLISDPAPSNVPSIPYQIFIKDTVTNVEWLVVSGNISVITRYVGAPGDSTIEINPPLDEEVIDIDVEVTYTQADLDEAVRQARQAAAWSCAYKNESCAASAMASCYMTGAQSAKTSACYAASTAMGWSECANTAANTAHSWADCALAQAGIAGQERTSACSAAATAITYSDCASNAMSAACTAADTAGIYKGQACGYSTCAINQATLAGASREAACSAAVSSFAWKQESCAAASASCTYADAASTSASTAAGWATCAQTQAASAMDWSAIAKQWALGQPSEPTGNSSKYWANQAATVVTGAAQRAENNTFSGTNTFNGNTVLNGPVSGTGIRDYNAEMLINMSRSYMLNTNDNSEKIANLILQPGPNLAVLAPNWTAHTNNGGTRLKWAENRTTVVGLFKELSIQDWWPTGWQRVDLVITAGGNISNHGWCRGLSSIPLLHLVLPEKTGIGSSNAFSATTTYGDLFFYAPKMTAMNEAFKKTTANTRKAKFYLPALNESRSLLPQARLDKESLIYTIDSLTKYTDRKYTLTIGRDNAMSDLDKAEVQSHADAKYDADTDTGWVITFNDN